MAITDSVKLGIYNGALRRLGSRQLASLTENRKPRRVLDGIWDSGGVANDVVNGALERGEWNFAIRAVRGVYSPSVETGFGFLRAYDKPDDFVRLASLCSDERFNNPLTNDQYVDEATYWLADFDALYIRYVSNGNDYGMDGAGWTKGFKDYLECKMAWEACETITNSNSKKDRLDRDMNVALATAKSHDAMGEGVKFPPRGSWLRARNIGNRSGDR